MKAASCGAVRALRAGRGFTLVELAVVLFIVGLILGSMMFTLSAQVEQSNRAETLRRLDSAKELLLAFAIVNGRLPCPAICTDPPICSAGGVEAGVAGVCTNSYGGFLPAVTIGYQQVDARGYAVDAWGNRLRYAVAPHATNPDGSTGCSSPVKPASFTNATNLKASTNGVNCAPLNIVVCDAVQNTSDADPGNLPPTCGTWAVLGDARQVTNQRTVVAVVFSTGKNTPPPPSICATCTDENANTDNNGVFVYHEPRPTGAQGGEYDDQMVWIPAGLLYGKLIAAGVLP